MMNAEDHKQILKDLERFKIKPMSYKEIEPLLNLKHKVVLVSEDMFEKLSKYTVCGVVPLCDVPEGVDVSELRIRKRENKWKLPYSIKRND